MSDRKVSNLLGLAVMGCLGERPMHPYEMASTMRERRQDQSIKVNYSSLYNVIRSLERDGLVRVKETVKKGSRPERTVYELTDEGRLEFIEWLSELLREPVREYTHYLAGLSLLAGAAPDEAVFLLQQRCLRLENEIRTIKSLFAMTAKQGVERLFLIEAEYQQEMLKAELAWTRKLIKQIESGKLEGIEKWRSLHEAEEPDELSEKRQEKTQERAVK